MEIPVYLFTGFLESGKTTFIQEALEGDDFNAGERTLFLLCEEGEAEYHPSRFFGTKVFFETIEDEEELTTEHLRDLQLKHKVERVVVEYNGMWNLLSEHARRMGDVPGDDVCRCADFSPVQSKHEAAGL